MIAMGNRNFIERITTGLGTLLLLGALAVAAGPAGAAMPVAGDGGVRFSLDAPGAAAVHLAGDFNGWNATDLPLTAGDGGLWTVTVSLAPGSYEYKFVVDGDWREDPANPESKADPFGGANSVVTVLADGTVKAAGPAPAATPAARPAAKPTAGGDVPDRFAVGAPRAVTGGVLFTYRGDGAGRVTLAGSFNDWNADAWPMESDDKGNWSLVKPLDAGAYEYKFVADGNWHPDPENPSTASDPYGGVNSLVTVDADGRVIDAPAPEAAAVSLDLRIQGLETKATIDGRYFTRFEYAKDRPVSLFDETIIDDRFRLQRPAQSVDLNVRTEISDAARTFMRLRMDSDQNIIQDNVAAILDEAFIQIHPRNFTLKAYWNQEIFSGEDLLHLGGDIDLPGTIMHDHLDSGKGSAGSLFEADPLGLRMRFFAANVYNFDYYNDPNLFDNTGLDRFALRFSRPVGPFTIGTPLYVERTLAWFDFENVATGIFPRLDEFRARTGDNSTWYRIDDMDLRGGLDLAYEAGPEWTFGLETLFATRRQSFVTGNSLGEDGGNGNLDVPIYDRKGVILAAEAAYAPRENLQARLLHVHHDEQDASAEDSYVTYAFKRQDEADNQFIWRANAAPAAVDQDSTDLRIDWTGDEKAVSLWLRRTVRTHDYGAVGRVAPEDTVSAGFDESIWYLAGKGSLGVPSDPRGHVELEVGYTGADRGVAGVESGRFEAILRYDRDLGRNTGLIADLRWARYHFAGDAVGTTGETVDTDYFNPFVGIRYNPIRRLELVVAYGIDPVDFSIDYDGRQIGRWLFRQQYLWDHPQATELEAENFLKSARTITMRAQMTF